MSTRENTSSSGRPWRLAILISGSGRTLENLLAVIERGELDAVIVGVVSSVDGVRGIGIAEAHGIPVRVVSRTDARGTEAYSRALYDAIAAWSPDLVIMAGFLRRMLVFPGWEGRILNIHPALLPDAGAYAAGKGMYGDRVHAAVIGHGDAESGATVHIVTDLYDEGPPLAQVRVPVLATDDVHTLASRVFAAECQIYPAAIRAYMRDHPTLRRH